MYLSLKRMHDLRAAPADITDQPKKWYKKKEVIAARKTQWLQLAL